MPVRGSSEQIDCCIGAQLTNIASVLVWFRVAHGKKLVDHVFCLHFAGIMIIRDWDDSDGRSTFKVAKIALNFLVERSRAL